MDVKQAIQKRRAYRSLKPFSITQQLIDDLSSCAQLSPSCFNNQPWRYIFVYDKQTLIKMQDCLSTGNEWAYNASLLIAVVSKKDYDCVIRDRLYYQFDTGLATGFLILRATELNLVAHPIAGFSPKKVREILEIDDDLEVITLVIVGKHSDTVDSNLSEKQQHDETTRPTRIELDKFRFHNQYKK
jgi:nitroreductase